MNNIKICIITGCAGFIGSHLTEKCLEMGWYVYGIDKLSYCSYPLLMEELKLKYPKQFKFEHNDINNIKHLPDVDIIFNICAESHVDLSIENSYEFLKSNINGVHNLLEIIRHKKIRPLFYQMSTDEVYGDANDISSHIETDNYNPSNPYSFSKASADLLIKSFHRTYGIQYQIGRATNTWGIRQNPEKLIPRTCRNLLIGKKIPLHNYGTPIRTWLHVDDCVDGILTIVKDGNINEIYNIGGNLEIENWKVVAKIANILKIEPCCPEVDPTLTNATKEGNYYLAPMENVANHNLSNICNFEFHRSGQDLKYSLDYSKLKRLGWNNKYNLDNELPNVVEYYKNNFTW